MKKNDFKNLAELVFTQFLNFENQQLLNYKEGGVIKKISSFEFLQNVIFLSYALKNLGIKKGSKLAIYSYQNPVWLMVDFACQLNGIVSVPIFHNISKENLLFQLKNCSVKAIFIDNQDDFVQKNHFDKLQFVDEELPKNITNIITHRIKSRLKAENVNDIEGLIALGREIYENKNLGDLKNLVLQNNLKNLFKKLDLQVPNKDDLATIVYTSGSTGKPKGVELSHDNLVSQIKGAAQRFSLNDRDRALSFLPLAHIFERMVMMFYISRSVTIFFVDDLTKIGENLQRVRPTIMTVVPRLLEKLFAKIRDKSNSGSFVKRTLAGSALNRSLSKNVEQKRSVADIFYDKVIYKKYRQALGGKMKLMICGGAALSEDMERFYRNIGINLFCGYGLTETSPVLAVNYKDNYQFGSVGKVYPNVKLKVAKDGELLAKGRGLMLGYHKSPKKNQEIFDKGWLKTGDLAQIDKDGFVKITGRKKELFKTSAGKYVMPVPIEQKLVQELGFLTGAIIIAEARNFVAALLFPDFELLQNLQKRLRFSGSAKDFLQSIKLNDFTAQKISEINGDLDRSNQILQFKIIAKQISIAGGEITPSMKLKRSLIEKIFKDEIAQIYRNSN